jgi:HAD superfamily hydrolase (TIGR01450 family)
VAEGQQPGGGSPRHRGEVGIGGLIERYEALLFDSYGVLIHQAGPLPGAPALIGTLNAMGKPYFILTNDASRSPETAARRFHSIGLAIPPERIIGSGALIAPYFAAHGLRGARCLVLGPEDTLRFVTDAGGELMPIGESCDPDVVVVGDERGFPFLEAMDAALTAILRRLDRGAPIHLLLPNPDIMFLRGESTYGFTAGAMALMLEAAIACRFPAREEPAFVALGKPNEPIFREACRRAGTRNLVMIGDQLGADIAGANRFGIDSALMPTGLTHSGAAWQAGEIVPTYLLPTLLLGR